MPNSCQPLWIAPSFKRWTAGRNNLQVCTVPSLRQSCHNFEEPPLTHLSSTCLIILILFISVHICSYLFISVHICSYLFMLVLLVVWTALCTCIPEQPGGDFRPCVGCDCREDRLGKGLTSRASDPWWFMLHLLEEVECFCFTVLKPKLHPITMSGSGLEGWESMCDIPQFERQNWPRHSMWEWPSRLSKSEAMRFA